MQRYSERAPGQLVSQLFAIKMFSISRARVRVRVCRTSKKFDALSVLQTRIGEINVISLHRLHHRPTHTCVGVHEPQKCRATSHSHALIKTSPTNTNKCVSSPSRPAEADTYRHTCLGTTRRTDLPPPTRLRQRIYQTGGPQAFRVSVCQPINISPPTTAHTETQTTTSTNTRNPYSSALCAQRGVQ